MHGSHTRLFTTSVTALLLLAGAGCSGSATTSLEVQGPTPTPTIEASPTEQIEPTGATTSSTPAVPAPSAPKSSSSDTTINVKSDTSAKIAAPIVQPTVRTITMTAKQWAFSPETIRAKKGDIVRITLTDADVPHSFILSDFNVNVKIAAGETKTFEFTADKIGTFTFFCGIPCGPGHKEMKGTLVVE